MSTQIIFVTSATGTQGEAVARLLRELGWTVHATVRDLNAPAAKHLEGLGVKLTEGLYLNLIPAYMTGDISGEPTQAMIAQVQQNKLSIENMVRDSGFEYWTILRGAYFMANFVQPKVIMFPGLVENNTWSTGLTPTTRVPLVDCEDLGKFTVAALQNPEKFHQQGIAVAGDKRTPDQVIELLSAATGRGLKVSFYDEKSVREMAATNPFIMGDMSLREMDRYVDLDGVKAWGVPMSDFKQYLEREKKAVQATYL